MDAAPTMQNRFQSLRDAVAPDLVRAIASHEPDDQAPATGTATTQ